MLLQSVACPDFFVSIGGAMSASPIRIQSAAAARILGVSQRSVQSLAIRGEIPGAARIGGVWTFDSGKLAAFITQRERDAANVAEVGYIRPAVRLPTRSQTSAAYERLMAQRH
jgi:hypothetical protein